MEYGSSPVEQGALSIRSTPSGCAGRHSSVARRTSAVNASRSRKNHVSGTTTASIDGHTFPVDYRFDPDLAHPDGSSFTGSIIIITPASYWPYAGADGLPIYDTVSGALLPGRTPLL